jgi:multisubunit Na+/H+ antiporter MnhB subunit
VRWGAFLFTAAIVTLIILYEWPKMKQNPKKDKVAFLTLLLTGLVLSMFNLPQMSGPTQWIETLFKPFGEFMEK